MAQCLIGLGSNIGDSEAALRAAWEAVGRFSATQAVRLSRIATTQPVGGPPGQPKFSNAVGLIETSLDPETLLRELQATERSLGRVRLERWGPRAIDLDLLTYDQLELRTPALTLPHPRMAFRRFVLEPAAEVAPNFVCAPNGWTIERLLEHLNHAPLLIALAATDDGLLQAAVERIYARARMAGMDRSAPTNAVTLDEWTILTGWPLESRESGCPAAGNVPPKLVVLIDSPSDSSRSAEIRRSRWRTLVRCNDVGPSLWMTTSDAELVADEVIAAMTAMR